MKVAASYTCRVSSVFHFSHVCRRVDSVDRAPTSAQLVEACSAVAGACLEQTTWLRRNLAVRAAPGGTPDRDQTASPEPGKPTSNGQCRDLPVLASAGRNIDQKWLV